ncbi:MAG: hypothetical protein AAFR98_02670 [Pseudomonadota bacterium]
MASTAAQIARSLQGTGIAALIINEDGIALAETLRHLRACGVSHVVIAHRNDTLTTDLDCPSFTLGNGALEKELTAIIRLITDQWLHLCFNGEFLAFPFAESRSLLDFCTFLQEERRRTAHVTVVDHYAGDLASSEFGISLQDAWFDAAGYYARHSQTPTDPVEPIVDIYGGLRWRYEEEFPAERRRVNRAALFRCRADLELTSDLRFTDPHMNTLQAPWHHSPTGALRSFRAAKYLVINPGSRKRIATFKWPQSVACDWTSSQLMDLGFIEPGQWF